jgi:predicted nucleic acid-binding protein
VILTDTSIWVNHFRKADPRLERHLRDGDILIHPFVVGELACGNLHRRREILRLLEELPAAPLARHEEVHELVEGRRLWGKGIGWIDAHLLASSLLSGSRLWTADRRLRSVAKSLGLRSDRL